MSFSDTLTQIPAITRIKDADPKKKKSPEDKKELWNNIWAGLEAGLSNFNTSFTASRQPAAALPQANTANNDRPTRQSGGINLWLIILPLLATIMIVVIIVASKPSKTKKLQGGRRSKRSYRGSKKRSYRKRKR